MLCSLGEANYSGLPLLTPYTPSAVRTPIAPDSHSLDVIAELALVTTSVANAAAAPASAVTVLLYLPNEIIW